MNLAIGETLPFAVAIAISPIPIIATILLLMSERARSLGLSFLGGWVVGIAFATMLFTLLAGVIPEQGDTGAKPVVGVIQLVLGLTLLLLAVKQWRSRPQAGEEPELPGWMAKIQTMKPLPVVGFAFMLAAVNPKNILMAVAAGTIVGQAGLSAGAGAATIAVFVVIAALSVCGPIVAYLVAPERAAGALDKLRIWLIANNATIMSVVLVLLGVQMLGKAIASF
ncbi:MULTISPECIES: GAP family protein [unclassified Leucobacter]|uniref:GAP family protein n=1 Tax=unclassified Leucobacter TaxID=2621730 RepID=UPI00165E4E43|nr:MULTISPECIES: GAP family protein [unclassified Leucobacter]MBC9935915.1 GAP family protein [Leucobacter sp. cx-87]